MTKTISDRRFILASNSPRRRSLLAEAGYAFEVIAPDPACEESARPNESAPQMVVRLATAKAKYVADRWNQTNGDRAGPAIILGADTVAECQGALLGKPNDRQHAREILQALRGRQHSVWTGICLWIVPEQRHWSTCVQTRLEMDALSDEQIDGYLETGSWRGKAGAFGYQDGNDWVKIIEGSPSNVVGLPLERLAEILEAIAGAEPSHP
jgi:septum formation protein